MLDSEGKKKRGTIWKLFFEPEPDSNKRFVSANEMVWVLGLLVFSIIALAVLLLFKFLIV